MRHLGGRGGGRHGDTRGGRGRCGGRNRGRPDGADHVALGEQRLGAGLGGRELHGDGLRFLPLVERDLGGDGA